MLSIRECGVCLGARRQAFCPVLWVRLSCARRREWDERAWSIVWLGKTVWGRFTVGQQFVTPDPKVFVQVSSIDATFGAATIRLWDIAEGGLRKEDSKPRGYLIENGAKRWITSPEALFALGKSWADVRIAADGALISVPAGQDIIL